MKKSFVAIFAALSVLPLVQAVTHAQDNVVARIGDISLTDDEMQKEAAMEIFNAENQVFQVKRNWINQRAKNIIFSAEAKAAKLSQKAWEEREIDSKVTPPTPAEIQQMMQRYPPQQASNPDMLKQITQYMTSQKRSAREQQVMSQLSAKYPITVLIKGPEMPKVPVTYRPDDPAKGPQNAPVTLIEFTDFQCPFCQRSQETLRQVEAAYPDKVKLVARQYPLPFHNRAKPSSEAAMCAKEQGKFWEFRDKLFAKQQLEDTDFIRDAQELKLNMKKFEKCLKEQRYAARIDEDINEGKRFGVQGTPHFFVNGRPLSGAQPFASFKQIIDEELAKNKK